MYWRSWRGEDEYLPSSWDRDVKVFFDPSQSDGCTVVHLCTSSHGKSRLEALLLKVLDESLSFGVLGDKGLGLCEMAGVAPNKVTRGGWKDIFDPWLTWNVQQNVIKHYGTLGIFQEAGVVSHVDVRLVHAFPRRWMPSWVRWSWLWLAWEASALDVTRPWEGFSSLQSAPVKIQSVCMRKLEVMDCITLLTGSLENLYDLTGGNHRKHSKVDHFGFNRR